MFYYVFESEELGLFAVEEASEQAAIAVAKDIHLDSELIEQYLTLEDMDAVYGEDVLDIC